MKAALSIFLAALLLILPVEQVLGQEDGGEASWTTPGAILSPSFRYQKQIDAWDIAYFGATGELGISDNVSFSGSLLFGQGPNEVQVHVPIAGLAAHLLRVPPLTENTARLFRTPFDRALLDTEFAGAVLVPGPLGWWNDLNGWKKTGVVLGAIVVTGATWGGIKAAGENNNPESFKSKYNVAEGAGRYALYSIPVVAVVAGFVWLCILEGACATNQ